MDISILNNVINSAVAQTGVSSQLDLFEMLEHASTVGLVVLGVLVLFSVVSWGIIIYKYFYLRRAHLQSVKFLEQFWTAEKMESIYQTAESLVHSPIAQVFKSGYVEFKKSRQRKAEDQSSPADSFSQLGDLESIERSMRRAITSQVTLMESLVGFLATTGSSAPFIGLFGTVWGIMLSFHKIGLMQNASLATVAPGISEALIATAFGLGAAIPAVIGYNFFVQKIKVLDAEMENFSSDYLNILKRHFL